MSVMQGILTNKGIDITQILQCLCRLIGFMWKPISHSGIYCMMLTQERGLTYVVMCTWEWPTSWRSWTKKSRGCWSSHPGAGYITGNRPTWSRLRFHGRLSLIFPAYGNMSLSLSLKNIWSVCYLLYILHFLICYISSIAFCYLFVVLESWNNLAQYMVLTRRKIFALSIYTWDIDYDLQFS